jgi:hypothetical protein
VVGAPVAAAICGAATAFVSTIVFYLIFYKLTGHDLDASAWATIMSSAVAAAALGALSPMVYKFLDSWVPRAMTWLQNSIPAMIATLSTWWASAVQWAGPIADSIAWGVSQIANAIARAASQAGMPTLQSNGPMYSGMAGKCIDDYGGAANDGDTIDLSDCTSNPAQQWRYYSDSRILLGGTGRCMRVGGDGVSENSPVVLSQCTDNPTEVWQQAYGMLINPRSGMCLDDPEFSTANGTQLMIHGCNGGTNQQWSLPGGPSTGLSLTRTTIVRDWATGSCMDAFANVNPCYGDGTDAWQQWNLLQDGSGNYYFENAHTGQCLDDGSGLYMYSHCIAGDAAQAWQPRGNSYQGQFQNTLTGLCLDDNGQLYMHSCNGGGYQTWRTDGSM